MNRAWILGRLTRDPETRYTQSGLAVVTFAVADNEKDDVSFFECVMFGERGVKFAEFHAKGDSCYVEGRMKQERWESKSGEARSAIKVRVSGWEFVSSILGKKNAESSADSGDAFGRNF